MTNQKLVAIIVVFEAVVAQEVIYVWQGIIKQDDKMFLVLL